MFKAGVSETPHSTKQGIILEGVLQKYSPESVAGRRWHIRYFALYATTCELRYYRKSIESSWGNIPIGERGCIPLRLITRIDFPSTNKWKGCRFDLVVRYKGEGRYPGILIRPGHESNVFTTKTFKLKAPDPQTRLLWVTVIESLMQRHGWGLDATGATRQSRIVSRSPSMSPNHKSFGGVTLGSAATTAAPCHPGRPVQQPVLSFDDEDNSHENGSDYDGNRTAPPFEGQRAIKIPFSPGGRKGSLTVQSLTSPVMNSELSPSGRKSRSNSIRV